MCKVKMMMTSNLTIFQVRSSGIGICRFSRKGLSTGCHENAAFHYPCSTVAALHGAPRTLLLLSPSKSTSGLSVMNASWVSLHVACRRGTDRRCTTGSTAPIREKWGREGGVRLGGRSGFVGCSGKDPLEDTTGWIDGFVPFFCCWFLHVVMLSWPYCCRREDGFLCVGRGTTGHCVRWWTCICAGMELGVITMREKIVISAVMRDMTVFDPDPTTFHTKVSGLVLPILWLPVASWSENVVVMVSSFGCL